MYITEKIERYLNKGTVCESIINEAANPFNTKIIQDIKKEISQGKTTATEVFTAITKLPIQKQQQFNDAFSDYFGKTNDKDKGLNDLYGMLS